MEGAAAIAVGVGAVLVALYLTRKQEESTAMKAARITQQKNSAGLGLTDIVAAGIVGAATYAGGPTAGAKAYAASGIRL
jgi:hypothetical protein